MKKFLLSLACLLVSGSMYGQAARSNVQIDALGKVINANIDQTPFVATALGAKADGTTLDTSALVAASTAAMTAKQPVTLAAGTYKVGTCTLAADLVFRAGAVLSPVAGSTVTLLGAISAPRAQIFAGAAVQTTGGIQANYPIVATAKVNRLYPEWFGVTGTADDGNVLYSMLSFVARYDVGATPVTVDLDTTKEYTVDAAGKVFNGYKNLCIEGRGARIKGPASGNYIFIGGGFPGDLYDATTNNRYLFHTAYPGASTLTLITSANAASLVVGSVICIGSEDCFGYGYPPSFRNQEYNEIAAINTSTGVITLKSPLQRIHKEDYPEGAGQLSKARFFPLLPSGGYANRTVIKDITFTNNACPILIGSNYAEANNVSGYYSSATTSNRVLYSDCQFGEVEPDKLCNSVELLRCEVDNLNYALGCNEVILTKSRISAGAYLGCRRLVVRESYIGYLISFQSTMELCSVEDSVLGNSALGATSSSTYTVGSNLANNTILTVANWASNSAFATFVLNIGIGKMVRTSVDAGAVSGRVLDIATTNEGADCVVTFQFNGTVPSGTILYPVVVDNVVFRNNKILSEQSYTNGIGQLTYESPTRRITPGSLKYLITSKDAPIPNFQCYGGPLQALIINVVKPDTSATASLSFQPFSFVAASYTPIIDIKTPGRRIITPTGSSGIQPGDVLPSSPPSGPFVYWGYQLNGPASSSSNSEQAVIELEIITKPPLIYSDNAAPLGGSLAAPGPIGATTPSTGAFTTVSSTGGISVNRSNSDYVNTNGDGSAVVVSNPNSFGQNVVSSIIGGNLVAKWRTDYAGNISWVSGGGGHDFFTGGDYPAGSSKLSIANGGNVSINSGNLQINGAETLLPRGSAPAAPSSGVTFYVDSSGDLHALHANGTNHVISAR